MILGPLNTSGKNNKIGMHHFHSTAPLPGEFSSLAFFPLRVIKQRKKQTICNLDGLYSLLVVVVVVAAAAV